RPCGAAAGAAEIALSLCPRTYFGLRPGPGARESGPADRSADSGAVASTSRCPVFIARDLSGFAFCLPLTEGARRATKVSGKQKVKSDGGPTLGRVKPSKM